MLILCLTSFGGCIYCFCIFICICIDCCICLLQPKGGEIQLKPPDYFRLEQLQEEFNFCDDMDIANNKRYQLLELRDGEVADFKNYKMVPALEKEIPRDTFTVSLSNLKFCSTFSIKIMYQLSFNICNCLIWIVKHS